MSRIRRIVLSAWLAVTLLPLLPTGCVLPSSHDHSAEIPIGALLPFTGDVAATGTNIERAQILAFENINQAGGVARKSLWLDARDTHSQTRRGLEMARELLAVPGLQALLGPEEEDLALSMVPLIKDAQVVQITGGVTSPIFSTVDDTRFW